MIYDRLKITLSFCVRCKHTVVHVYCILKSLEDTCSSNAIEEISDPEINSWSYFVVKKEDVCGNISCINKNIFFRFFEFQPRIHEWVISFSSIVHINGFYLLNTFSPSTGLIWPIGDRYVPLKCFALRKSSWNMTLKIRDGWKKIHFPVMGTIRL